jgi:hypothetical protein
MTNNRIRFEAMCKQAEAMSLTDEYRGCIVHVNAQVRMHDGEPIIASYTLDDWADGCTVASYVNGQMRD